MHLVKIMGSDSLSGEAPSVGKASARMALREQQASCTRQKWHRRVLSEPNLKLAKPERAPVLSSLLVPGITDTD